MLASSSAGSQGLERWSAAYRQARGELLDARCPTGQWVGELSTSALSTATAISALSLAGRHGGKDLSRWITRGVEWLAAHQNPDGGWGDTDRSYSNIATTMLARAAFHLAGVASERSAALERAVGYIDSQGGVAGLRRRYGRDKTFAVPILTNCALAGLAEWRDVSPLPFELAVLPQSWYRFAQLPVVSYAIPALVAIGQARHYHRPTWNPLTWIARKLAARPSLGVLDRMQPASGGYLEAVPLTSFVVMSLASIGQASHSVCQRGTQFILDSTRPDGSWPIDTNLATWNTSLALQALATAGESLPNTLDTHARVRGDVAGASSTLDWHLSCQHRVRHPFTGAEPGGWGWTDLSGAVPDADDTPGALLALAAWRRDPAASAEERERIVAAARLGVHWLLQLQNRDGGWPTFCRGWGKLPFDRSGADLTAHALRALENWRAEVTREGAPRRGDAAVQRAMERGWRYILRSQNADGSWTPLWFGNQDHPREENPVYGTAKVLLALAERPARAALAGSTSGESTRGAPGTADDERLEAALRRGLAWLAASQRPDGSWGSVEETALATEAWGACARAGEWPPGLVRALDWLSTKVETRRHLESAPIGFYFARLWYYEQLYPLTFTVAALGRVLRRANAMAESHLSARMSDL